MKNKDWVGNKKSTFSTLGASSHSLNDRETNDFYATDRIALDKLLDLQNFSNVWECACGQGHLSKVLIEKQIHGRSSDLIDRGYGETGIDFLGIDNLKWDGDIITNPPFKYAEMFVRKGLQIIPNGSKVAMFLRIQFLETKERKELFKNFPPKYVYVSSSRIQCAMNGQFEKYSKNGSASCYCWFIWEKGFNGDTIIKWFN